ncbi:MarR family transcriptional regulator [Saxibacter everestensis]|uniref:MarR family transcriptional regulator n=1 Tax=Saxibacter everestensis TaxID=2909229 RepID=A0ABY8QPV1_9MICO|nr:MarR family transcriptional regulator [Brevibacteriaceae bacterium ZFBP1038]
MHTEDDKEVRDQRDRLMEGLRTYGRTYAELGRRFAASLGLHSTDASALLEILAAEERGTPLSPARLSERIALTAGATSSLLNRLEASGHIVRTRVHTDRRVVTLQSTPGMHGVADEFFEPLAGRLNAMMGAYPMELLGQFESFLTELRVTMDTYAQEHTLRDENDGKSADGVDLTRGDSR